jgi:hypothetical protein
VREVVALRGKEEKGRGGHIGVLGGWPGRARRDMGGRQRRELDRVGWGGGREARKDGLTDVER